MAENQTIPEPPTRMLRAKQDLADMFAWVCRAEGIPSASMLDILLRPLVLDKYAKQYARIVELKKNEDAAAQAAGKKPGPPLPDLSEEMKDRILRDLDEDVSRFDEERGNIDLRQLTADELVKATAEFKRQTFVIRTVMESLGYETSKDEGEPAKPSPKPKKTKK